MSVYLEITVFDGTERLFTKNIKAGTIGDKKLEEMMRCLTATYAALDGHEIVSSYLNRNSRSFHDHLVIRKDTSPQKYVFSCGDSVHTIVRAVLE
ncbi:hypothetical protein [Halomonas elongata]|uniref:hypothetical protein n=1 Tax=Halomonas elongata TaxID=2746 RepID=UPI00186BB13B|nr:hypothetical protein [Halomonas elongata]MBW5800639.1 hypothetical protein [Halomonas elongata]